MNKNTSNLVKLLGILSANYRKNGVRIEPMVPRVNPKYAKLILEDAEFADKIITLVIENDIGSYEDLDNLLFTLEVAGELDV